MILTLGLNGKKDVHKFYLLTCEDCFGTSVDELSSSFFLKKNQNQQLKQIIVAGHGSFCQLAILPTCHFANLPFCQQLKKTHNIINQACTH
jgi:hypothetical protein